MVGHTELSKIDTFTDFYFELGGSKGGVKVSKAGVKHSEVKELLMKDKEFKKEYEKLKLREELLAVEQDRLAGREGCTPEDLDKYLDDIIKETEHGKDSAAT